MDILQCSHAKYAQKNNSKKDAARFNDRARDIRTQNIPHIVCLYTYYIIQYTL